MVEDLIRRARRRLLFNETLAQSAFAAAVVIGGFALLLIVGTRYMEWWTLAIIAAVGIAIGSYRVYRRTPDHYATAVQLDDNARLKDALSTALYFSGHEAGSPEFLRSQREQAEETAGTVHLEQAVPFVIPRALYAVAALCVLASALIALRFGMGHGLDLRAPITEFLFEDQAAQAAAKRPAALPKSGKQWMDEAQSLLAKLGMGQKPADSSPDDQDALDKAIEQALQNPDSSGKNQKGSTKAGEKEEGAADESPNGDPLDNGEQSSVDQSESKPGDKNSKAASGKSANSGSRESLLARLKDAVSDMLSDADKDENPSQSQKSQRSAKDQADGSKGKQGKGDRQKGSQAEGEPEGQPDAAGQSDDAQGVLTSNTEKQPGQGNGAGSQNGLKEIKEAAQLKAMGKISEIIGQRAATVSGETSVEVQSGNQKLRTAYSDTTAAHGETDGDVTRDEIPLALQAYVQQYFAEVRKTGAVKPKPASK
jgi:hypothetical protein